MDSSNSSKQRKRKHRKSRDSLEEYPPRLQYKKSIDFYSVVPTCSTKDRNFERMRNCLSARMKENRHDPDAQSKMWQAKANEIAQQATQEAQAMEKETQEAQGNGKEPMPDKTSSLHNEGMQQISESLRKEVQEVCDARAKKERAKERKLLKLTKSLKFGAPGAKMTFETEDTRTRTKTNRFADEEMHSRRKKETKKKQAAKVVESAASRKHQRPNQIVITSAWRGTYKRFKDSDDEEENVVKVKMEPEEKKNPNTHFHWIDISSDEESVQQASEKPCGDCPSCRMKISRGEPPVAKLCVRCNEEPSSSSSEDLEKEPCGKCAGCRGMQYVGKAPSRATCANCESDQYPDLSQVPDSEDEEV